MTSTTHLSNQVTKQLILKHIVATMSERAAIEIKFNTLLQDYKTMIMPAIIENFDTMPEDEQKPPCELLLWSPCTYPHFRDGREGDT